jgi:hypothetical protein
MDFNCSSGTRGHFVRFTSFSNLQRDDIARHLASLLASCLCPSAFSFKFKEDSALARP